MGFKSRYTGHSSKRSVVGVRTSGKECVSINRGRERDLLSVRLRDLLDFKKKFGSETGEVCLSSGFFLMFFRLETSLKKNVESPSEI